MECSLLAEEMLAKTGEMMRTSWPKQMHTFLHGEMFILHYIWHRKADALPSELSAAMKTSTARIAMALKSLEEKGFVKRSIDKADRRRVKVSLTDLGKEMVLCQHAQMRETVENILVELGEEDAKEYIRIVSRMLEISKKRQA